MSLEIICGLIGTVFGAVTGAFVSFIGALLTTKYNYNHLFAEVVSKNRHEWITLLREKISNLLAAADIIYKFNLNNHIFITNGNIDESYYNNLKLFYTAKYEILTRLNLEEEKHLFALDLIQRLESEMNQLNSNYEQTREIFLSNMRLILKEEWERVKLEAKGKRR